MCCLLLCPGSAAHAKGACKRGRLQNRTLARPPRYPPPDLLNPATFPVCTLLQELYGDEQCLALHVEPRSGFYVALVAVLVHGLSGYDGSWTHRYAHRRIYQRGAHLHHPQPGRDRAH